MAKILGLGIATLDELVLMESFPGEDQKTRTKEAISWKGGGNCADTLVALSRLGLETTLLTGIGKDRIGEQIIDSLKAEGINTSHVTRKGDRSPYSVILIGKNNGSRTVIHQPGLSYETMLEYPDSVIENIDLVYLDGRFHSSAKRLAELAQKINIPIVLESESAKPKFEELWQYARVVVTSESFHRDYFDSDDISENLLKIVEKGPEIVIATLGKNGSLLRTEEDVIKVPAYKINVVDTTGAGDAFIGGFIFGYLQTWSHEHCLRFASMVAAKKCTVLGAREGLPYRENVLSYINNPDTLP